MYNIQLMVSIKSVFRWLAVLTIYIVVLSCGCPEPKNVTGYDYCLFNNSPAWELAKAVRADKYDKVKEILRHKPHLINYPDSKYGNTLITLAIRNRQLEMVKLLIEHGADVNHHDKHFGTSPIISVCAIYAGENYKLQVLDLLLAAGANVNDVEVGERPEFYQLRHTPLMLASRRGDFKVVQYLIYRGADIHYENEYNESALTEALSSSKYDVVLYLLQKGVDCRRPIYSRIQEKSYSLVEELRHSMPYPNTIMHIQKMDLVEYLRGQGIEYKDVPIPEYVIKEAKRLYPDSWQEYLEQY